MHNKGKVKSSLAGKSHHILAIIILFSFHRSSAQCLSGNCTNGWGTYLFDTGDKYTGEWVGGARTGLGVYDWKSGSFYYGYFQNSKLEGEGFFFGLDSTRDQFGIFHDGVLSEKKNYESSGCLLGNCLDGSGIYLWTTNDIYIGQWQNGGRTGYGRYDWDNGSWYIGYFKEGKPDGQGEYHPKGMDVMKGTFVNGEFQGSTSSSSAKSSRSAISYPDRKISQADFCSVMKNVIADFPNDFENIKGVLDEGDDLGDSWDATWKFNGTTESKIMSSLVSNHNTWYNVLYESRSYADARAMYDSYVSTMKSCGCNCCSLKFDTRDSKSDNNQNYLTYWLPFSLKEGYSDDYLDMEIEIELSQKVLDKGWEILVWVKEARD